MSASLAAAAPPLPLPLLSLELEDPPLRKPRLKSPYTVLVSFGRQRSVNGSSGGEIVLQDPYHPYAVRFMEIARDRGLRDHALGTGLGRHLSSVGTKLDGLLWKAGWRR